MSGIVNQLLPLESQRALDEFGAAQFELSPMARCGLAAPASGSAICPTLDASGA